MTDDTTHFGYERVAADEKSGRVRVVFDSVADRYDLMNDLMSLGLHRGWKRFAVALAGLREGDAVLDLASGSGDLAALLSREVGETGRVVPSDINGRMLGHARARLIDAGLIAGLDCVQADAERLPFAADSFDVVTIGFGLRNVTRIPAALAEMHRVLKPGGRALVLEFSRPRGALLNAAYDAWSFGVIPVLGRAVTGDEKSYRYLAESIRMHPDQETLAGLLRAAGFERVEVFNLAGGIVAVHRGVRL